MEKEIITRLKEAGLKARYYIDKETREAVYEIDGEGYVTFGANESEYKDVYLSKYKDFFIRFNKDEGPFLNL